MWRWNGLTVKGAEMVRFACDGCGDGAIYLCGLSVMGAGLAVYL